MILTSLLQFSDWALFIGRMHPLLVHLPIGFLFIALFLEIAQRFGKVAVTERCHVVFIRLPNGYLAEIDTTEIPLCTSCPSVLKK